MFNRRFIIIKGHQNITELIEFNNKLHILSNGELLKLKYNLCSNTILVSNLTEIENSTEINNIHKISAVYDISQISYFDIFKNVPVSDAKNNLKSDFKNMIFDFNWIELNLPNELCKNWYFLRREENQRIFVTRFDMDLLKDLFTYSISGDNKMNCNLSNPLISKFVNQYDISDYILFNLIAKTNKSEIVGIEDESIIEKINNCEILEEFLKKEIIDMMN